SVLGNAEKMFSFFSGNVIGTFILPHYHSCVINGTVKIEKPELLTALSEVIEKFENSLKFKYVSGEKSINTINRIKAHSKNRVSQEPKPVFWNSFLITVLTVYPLILITDLILKSVI